MTGTSTFNKSRLYIKSSMNMHRNTKRFVTVCLMLQLLTVIQASSVNDWEIYQNQGANSAMRQLDQCHSTKLGHIS
ncbi:unnamed protein product [Heterobilharzia americana]|nr:unnamed protein product [Heterobilharzia americana]